MTEKYATATDKRKTKTSVTILVETDFSILSILIIHVMVLLEVGRKKDRRNKSQDGRVEQR